MVIKCNKLFFFLSLFFCIYSCKTVEEVKKVDYSDVLSVLCEVDKVSTKLDEKEDIEALSIAKNLIENRDDVDEARDSYQKALEHAKKTLKEKIEKKNWKGAFLYFNSIKACEPSFDDGILKTINNELNTELYKKHPLLLDIKNNTTSSKIAKTIDEMIDATVTVFVDRGIKVEKGMGYSDIILGSGFFIDDEGHFITNYHVIQSEVDPKYEGYSKLYIKNFEGGKDKIPAKVIGYDALLDLALVKAQVKPSRIFKLGSSEKLKVGNKCYAIGSPLGLERTITQGIISSKDRQLIPLVDVIQLDAAINHGSSGGPMVDENGEVQGVLFAGITKTQGLNFAIPVELLKLILPSLYIGGEHSHSWLGSYGKDIDEGDDVAFDVGVIASYVMPSGAAAKAGITDNAIITHINDRKVKNLASLKLFLMELPNSSIIKVSGKMKIEGEWKAKNWFPVLQKRPESPASLIYQKDTVQRCVLPFYGLVLENAGHKRRFRVKEVIRHSYGDESGFMVNDYLEIRNMQVDESKGIVQTLFYAKKLKAAYIESFVGAATYSDNSGYF
ncbi:MAG: trypsin-like peptidase domain-containing protein [Treponema sp.]